MEGFFIEKRLLQRVRPAIDGEALNGHDLLAGGRLGGSAARADRLAAEQHSAGPALSFAATVFGSREAQPVAQDGQQRFTGRALSLAFSVVYDQGDGGHGRGRSLGPARLS